MACTGSVTKDIFNGNHELDVLQILLQPTPDAVLKLIQMLENDGALPTFVEGKNGVAAKSIIDSQSRRHVAAGRQIAIESLAQKGTGDRTIRTNQPEIEAKLLGDGESKIVAPAGDQDDFDSEAVGSAESSHIGRGNLKLGVQQGPVDVKGQQANGRRDQHRILTSCAPMKLA